MAAATVDDTFDDAQGNTAASLVLAGAKRLWTLAALALGVAFFKAGLEQLAQHRARGVVAAAML